MYSAQKYDLIKEETLEDALVPQEGKYPSGSVVDSGYLWDFNIPEIGKAFYVHQSKTSVRFRTSPVNKILEETKEHIRFETWNSIYTIKFKD